MSTLADAMFEIEVEEVKQRYKNADEFVPGGDLSGVMEGGGMTASSTAEYVPIYSTKDGTVSMVTAKVAATKCRRQPDGSRLYTLDQPKQHRYVFDTCTGGVRKVTEGLMCYLHPEHERREEFEAVGLGGQECTKANIPSAFQLRLHMQRRHSQEWASIEDYEQRAREEADRDVQRQTLRLLQQRGPGRPPKEGV